ncbi:FHA domain-containing protein [Brevibacillus halotolerans]|uniref:FHA domain-containing protein n=1 Tax=Brevibacillus halotolerans TaxID=1507437 RepID=UPI0015EF86A4|nr:FHA domain-containing protein [Brevibacillus halotolerans]MBA4531323.1 FHA domain-containing protein [Brevibacillus halotolerans]
MQDQTKKYRSIWVIIIDVLLFVIAINILYFAFFIQSDPVMKWMVSLLGISFIIFGITSRKNQKQLPKQSNKQQAGITKLVLLDEDGERVKEWLIQGETSLVIGKNSRNGEVDIDLSDTEYASLISTHHAVLNHVGGTWFIEDNDSHNGVGIKKTNSNRTNKIEIEARQQIDINDLIYIANTRILVK